MMRVVITPVVIHTPGFIQMTTFKMVAIRQTEYLPICHEQVRSGHACNTRVSPGHLPIILG